MRGNITALAITWAVVAAACAGTSPTSPSAAAAAATPAGGSQASGDAGGTFAPTAGPNSPAEGMTDVTLANAGWTCIQPGNGLTLCGPPGTGIPPIPPVADGAATYNLMAFTSDHQFLHHVKFLRPDLYHGEPCVGGEPWHFLAIVGYYECIIPARGSVEPPA